MGAKGPPACPTARIAALIMDKNTSTGDLLNEFARVLPEDWELNIDIQTGYGEIFLWDDYGQRVRLNTDDATLQEQLLEALTIISQRKGQSPH